MNCKREKRKHKNSQQLKQERAEHKKKYLNRIRALCSAVGCEHVYNLIPREEQDKIYRHRIFPFKFTVAEGNEISGKVLSDIRMLSDYIFKDVLLAVTESGVQLSLYELYTIGLNFFEYLNSLKIEQYPDAPKVKELQMKFIPMNKLFIEADTTLRMYMSGVCFGSCDLISRIYWMKHSFSVDKQKPEGIINLMEVHSHIPEKIYDCKDNVYRPAFKVCKGFAETGIKHFRLDQEQLGIIGMPGNSFVEIYIQAHALQRIKERLDCMMQFYQNLYLINSISSIKIHKETRDRFLIEYKISEIKIGYLAADLSDGKLIIRTFLFITQHGTPEGNKLAELYGLGKLDKSYLELDKLSTFLTTDMCSNAELREVFQQAGCQYLLDIFVDNRIKSMCDIHSKQSSVMEIVKYLGLERKNDILNKKPA